MNERRFEDEVLPKLFEATEDPIDPNVMPIDVPVADTTLDSALNDPTAAQRFLRGSDTFRHYLIGSFTVIIVGIASKTAKIKSQKTATKG